MNRREILPSSLEQQAAARGLPVIATVSDSPSPRPRLWHPWLVCVAGILLAWLVLLALLVE